MSAFESVLPTVVLAVGIVALLWQLSSIHDELGRIRGELVTSAGLLSDIYFLLRDEPSRGGAQMR